MGRRRVRIAIFEDGSKGSTQANWREFRARLRALGWVEGENVSFIERFSQGARGRLPPLAAELVALATEVIAVTTTPARRAVMRSTSSVSIVFITGDPVGAGPGSKGSGR